MRQPLNQRGNPVRAQNPVGQGVKLLVLIGPGKGVIEVAIGVLHLTGEHPAVLQSYLQPVGPPVAVRLIAGLQLRVAHQGNLVHQPPHPWVGGGLRREGGLPQVAVHQHGRGAVLAAEFVAVGGGWLRIVHRVDRHLIGVIHNAGDVLRLQPVLPPQQLGAVVRRVGVATAGVGLQGVGQQGAVFPAQRPRQRLRVVIRCHGAQQAPVSRQNVLRSGKAQRRQACRPQAAEGTVGGVQGVYFVLQRLEGIVALFDGTRVCVAFGVRDVPLFCGLAMFVVAGGNKRRQHFIDTVNGGAAINMAGDLSNNLRSYRGCRRDRLRRFNLGVPHFKALGQHAFQVDQHAVEHREERRVIEIVIVNIATLMCLHHVTRQQVLACIVFSHDPGQQVALGWNHLAVFVGVFVE